MLLVLHFTADSTCWGSTFHIITTTDICDPQVLWLAEEPLTLEMQTANEVSAPGSREEDSKSMASGVLSSADTHSHCRPLKTHSRKPIQRESKHSRFSRDCSATLRVTQCEAVFLCFDYPAVLLSVLYKSHPDCEKHLQRNERTPDSTQAHFSGHLMAVTTRPDSWSPVMGISSLIYSDNCKTCYIKPWNTTRPE